MNGAFHAGTKDKGLNRIPHTEWLEDLIRENGRMVYTTALKILGSTEDADEVHQEVFLKLSGWTGKRLRNRGVEDWGAFLRVIATRKALDLLRSRNRHASKVKNFPIDELSTFDHGNPAQSASNREYAALLREALCRIKPRDAEVFLLRYVGGLKYEEIAHEASLSTSQIGVILHRTRARLEEILSPNLGDLKAGEIDQPKVIGRTRQ
ncbi:MAG: RNA polymerase sigma factor [Candidatus Omnitrophica bacterium]|nr:RNA polymerase sigma factor [Candidatus Omnitrophota bacterium]